MINIELTDEELAIYTAGIDQAVNIINTDPTKAKQLYYTADRLLEEVKFLPNQSANGKLLQAVKTHSKLLDFTLTDYRAAVKAITKEWNDLHKKGARAAAQEARSASLAASLGIQASDVQTLDERRYINAFMTQQGYRQGYDRQFWKGDNKEPILVADIINDALLTASTLALIKPRGDLLGATNIGRALEEWSSVKRAERKAEVWETIRALPAGADKHAIMTEFYRVCDLLFVDGPFAAAAILKFIWSVKRHLLNLTIKDHHMIVLFGPQRSGKTEFCRLLLKILADLASECMLKDVLDERQMDLMQNYALFPDELTYADRADITALKSFITGGNPARRPMRSNIAQKTTINATLIATSNHTLGKIIFDNSGMRRFVEIETKPRIGYPLWDQVAAFDFHALWQAVDPYADDPLMSKYETILQQRQEEMRSCDNTELWLNDWNPSNASNCKSRSSVAYEFWASDLYLDFHVWETTYDVAFKTSIQRWGRDFKAHIHAGVAQNWSTHKYGAKTVYVYTIPAEAANQPESPKTKVIRLPSR